MTKAKTKEKNKKQNFENINSLESLFQVGISLQKQGKILEASNIYKIILKNDKNHFDSNHMLGIIETNNNNTMAIQFLQKAIQINPNSTYAYSDLGISLYKNKRIDEAIKCFERAIQLDLANAQAYSNLGNILQEIGNYEEALLKYIRAIDIDSKFMHAHYNCANALRSLGKFDQAIQFYENTINLSPNFAEAHCNKGIALKELNLFDEALSSFNISININNNFADAYYNRGLVLHDLKRIDEALKSYDNAIGIKIDYVDAYWNKSLALLLSGDYLNGWKLHEYRWKTKKFTTIKRNYNEKKWLGLDDLNGKRIYVYEEQGIGDTIQFSRYLKLVKLLGAYVIFEISKCLYNFMWSLDGVNELITSDMNPTSFDFHCPLHSLPLALGTTIETIPNDLGYIKVNFNKIAKWKAKLGDQKKIRIGIAWSSVSLFEQDKSRSISFLNMMTAIPCEMFEIVCLQKYIKDEDYLEFSKSGIKFYGNELVDVEETAALISCLDLVISTCTSVPHISASIGKPTWVMLQYVPDWRWMLDREDSLWYQSVRLFRQNIRGDWNPVCNQIYSELLKYPRYQII